MMLASEGVVPTPTCLRSAEAALLADQGGEVLFCGRGATALYLAFALARRRGDETPEVVLPAASCATPANAACLAGYRPRFADVDPRTGLTNLEAIRARVTTATRAVVFIHLYGQTADLSALSSWCRERHIVLIEDLAQAQGACLPDGRPAGSVGDLAIYSFNATKILDCGGGALVIRRPEVTEALQALLARPWPPRADSARAAQLALSYRNLHHGLVDLLRLHPDASVAPLFLQLRPLYDGLYFQPMSQPETLAGMWCELAPRLAHRQANAARYVEALAGGSWRLLEGWRTSSVCWRFTLLVAAQHQMALTSAVRGDGALVSNHYWPVHSFFRPEDRCPHAVELGQRVVNLWVDQRTTREAVSACAASLRRHAGMLETSN
jgi:dTDP-4-amino-4,6-dideoxygalactose transaminase